MEHNVVHTGDAFDVLPDLPDESIHAVVTDPPYGLAFMGRDWDDFEPKEYQEWCEEWAAEVKRVLKPGGHLLAFSGNRTHHRLFTGVEDAGFEVRDTMTWHYGSGFPKASDISKTIDKREGVEPEEITEASDHGMWSDDGDWNDVHNRHVMPDATTDAAREWDGWKTGLKPATEFVVLARKPFDGATVDCVLEHGTGALNIDGTRIGDTDTTVSRGDDSAELGYMGGGSQPSDTGSENGRYPANVVFDATAAEQLDAKVGELAGGAHTPASDERNVYSNGDAPSSPETRQQLDSGGPSRYFYTSKASRSERTEDGTLPNDHPTVKPLDLMEWLVRLVTREDQVVLDPFAGSGTTLKAAKALNRRFIGIERQPEYSDLARARAGLTPEDPGRFRDDDAQSGIEAYTDGGPK